MIALIVTRSAAGVAVVAVQVARAVPRGVARPIAAPFAHPIVRLPGGKDASLRCRYGNQNQAKLAEQRGVD